MKRPVTAFVLALVSVVLSPILFIVELSSLFFAGMVGAEPSNPLVIKALAVALVVAIGLLAWAVAVLPLVMGSRARSASKSMSAHGSGLATAAMVIAGIVMAGVFASQVYLILMVVGECSLEGC